MKKIFSAVALFLALVCVPTLHAQALLRMQNVNTGGGGVVMSFVSPGAQTANCTAVSTTCTITVTISNGDAAFLSYTCYDTVGAQNPSLPSDSASNVWTKIFLNAGDAGNWYEEADWVVAAGGITTVAPNCGASTTEVNATLMVYHRTSGIWTLGTATSAAFGTSTTATSASLTPTASVPAIVLGWFLNKGSTVAWTTANSTIRQSASNAFHADGISTGDQIITTTSGSYAASANTGASSAWTAFAYYVK